jgi:lysosomal acid lipase/cholesteryl ester hydrolase
MQDCKLNFTIVNSFFAGDVFQAYDYGKIGNEKRYGSKKPMEYNLKKVTAPVR